MCSRDWSSDVCSSDLSGGRSPPQGRQRFVGCLEPALRLLRSEEHTSELQSRLHLVCRLLLEKKKHIPPPPSGLLIAQRQDGCVSATHAYCWRLTSASV